MWSSFEGYGVLPFGLAALYMLRIEAGLLLLDVDFSSSRFGWTDEDRSTPIELGWSWMLRGLADDDRAFIGRRAIEREIAEKTSRWRLTGLIVDWDDYDRTYDRAGLIPPKDHTPIHEEYFVYDDDGTPGRLRDEPDVLADAPAPHRADPGPPGARRARDGGQARARREPPLRVRRGADRPPAALQPSTKDGLT